MTTGITIDNRKAFIVVKTYLARPLPQAVLTKLSRLDCYFQLPATPRIYERKFQATLLFHQYLGRHRTGNDFIAGRQDDAVAWNAQRTLKNNLIAFGVIALVVFVRLDDFEAIFATRRYRMRQKHLDVVRGGAEILHG